MAGVTGSISRCGKGASDDTADRATHMIPRTIKRLEQHSSPLGNKALFALDSTCIACNRWARLLAWLDYRDLVRFAPVNSPAGRWMVGLAPNATFHFFRLGNHYHDGAALVELTALCVRPLFWLRLVHRLADPAAQLAVVFLRRRPNASKDTSTDLQPCPAPTQSVARRLMWEQPSTSGPKKNCHTHEAACIED